MLIATTLAAAALLASSPLGETPAASRQSPPLVVTVTTDSGLPQAIVSRLLDEAAAVWRPAGVTFVWRRGVSAPQSLHVTIGRSAGRQTDDALPLAWIVFDDDTTPESDIYVSYANVLALIAVSQGVVGRVDTMPPAQREELLGRALGRALAHEIGHYLLASKEHTAAGLMQTRRTAFELFSTHRTRFDIDIAQRRRIAARVEQLMLAQRVTAAAVSEGI